MKTWASIKADIELVCGLGTTATTNQKNQLEAFALMRLETAVHRAWWPNLMTVVQLAYAEAYDDSKTYAKDAVVWDGANLYYQSLKADNTGNDLTDTEWWAETNEVEAVIAAPDGTFFDAYATEEHALKGKAALRAAVQGGNIYILTNEGPAAPWIKYRKGVPLVNPPTAGEGETQIEAEDVPNELVQYIVLGTYADWLNDQGKVDSAARKEDQAEISLQNAVTEQVDQQGMQTPTHVQTPGAPIPGYYYRGQ